MLKHVKALTSLHGVVAILITIHNLGNSITLYSKFLFNRYSCVDLLLILRGFIFTHIYAKNFTIKVSIHNDRVFLHSRAIITHSLQKLIVLLFVGVKLISSLLIYLRTISDSIYVIHWVSQKSISLIYKSIFHVKIRTNFTIFHSVIVLDFVYLSSNIYCIDNLYLLRLKCRTT